MHDEQSAAMTDAALDREIARVLAVDPSSEFAARVRQRIASEPAPSGWRAAWIVATAGALAAVAVALFVVSRDRAIETTPPTLAARASSGVGQLPTGRARLSSGAGLSSGVGLSGPPRGPERAAPHQDSGPALQLSAHDPEILIDAREARAIRAFFEGVRDGRIDLTPLAAVAPRVAEPQPVPDIYIAPIVIDSLNERNGAGGVRQ
jgi:hypothetical protein